MRVSVRDSLDRPGRAGYAYQNIGLEIRRGHAAGVTQGRPCKCRLSRGRRCRGATQLAVGNLGRGGGAPELAEATTCPGYCAWRILVTMCVYYTTSLSESKDRFIEMKLDGRHVPGNIAAAYYVNSYARASWQLPNPILALPGEGGSLESVLTACSAAKEWIATARSALTVALHSFSCVHSLCLCLKKKHLGHLQR